MTEQLGFRIENVSIDYSGSPAVAGLDLRVLAGEILVVLGHSGCGKTTLLRALAGLLLVADGQLIFGEHPVSGPGPERAMAFQDDALLPWRSVLRNVELPLVVRGVSRAQRHARAVELLDQVGLAGFERHLPKQLSGGMRQRVQLARTLIAEPSAILMDEPFGALDAQNRRTMQELLIRVWKQRPTTVVFVTHDIDEALLLGDRIAVLSPRPACLQVLVDVPYPRRADQQQAQETAAVRAQLLSALDDQARDEGAR